MKNEALSFILKKDYFVYGHLLGLIRPELDGAYSLVERTRGRRLFVRRIAIFMARVAIILRYYSYRRITLYRQNAVFLLENLDMNVKVRLFFLVCSSFYYILVTLGDLY